MSMSQDLLHAMLQSLSRTDNAWTTASTAGAAHVQSVANAVFTFADLAVSPSASPPASNQLSSLHASATESLTWLRTTLTRLTAALRGARQTQDTIAKAVTSKSHLRDLVPTTCINSSHSLPIHTWLVIVSDINDGLERDLIDKQRVLHLLHIATQGGYVSRDELRLGVAMWLEQPDRDPGKAAMLVAAYEAEKAAVEESSASPVSSPVVTRQKSNGGQGDKAESPALAMLRQSGKKKG